MRTSIGLLVAALGSLAVALQACSDDDTSETATAGGGGTTPTGGAGGAGALGGSGGVGGSGTGGDATGGSGGSTGRYGTGTTATAEYVTVTGGGAAAPDAADGVTASCPGDCSTDATSCLQDAADDAFGQDKPLVLPAPSGECYLITQTVRVQTSVIGVDYPLIKVSGATGDSDQTALEIHGYDGPGIWITGLRIDGAWDPTGMTPPGGGEWSSGIELVGSSNITIQDNQIQNTAGDSIYFGSNGTGEANILVNANDLGNTYRCNLAFIHAVGVAVTNNHITKLNTYVGSIDFEPNDPAGGERVLDVEIAANATSVPNGPVEDGCTSVCHDHVLGASCSPDQGTPHGGSLFIHHNAVEDYMAPNVTGGEGPGFASNNSSTWSGGCSAQWQTGTNPNGSGYYVWDNPPGSGTTDGNAPE